MIIDLPQLTTVVIGNDSFIETTSLAFSSKTINQCSNNRSSQTDFSWHEGSFIQ